MLVTGVQWRSNNAYFARFIQTLQEQMIEELHNHLYLKSSYCDTLWSAYIKDQQDCMYHALPVERAIDRI